MNTQPKSNGSIPITFNDSSTPFYSSEIGFVDQDNIGQIESQVINDINNQEKELLTLMESSFKEIKIDLLSIKNQIATIKNELSSIKNEITTNKNDVSRQK